MGCGVELQGWYSKRNYLKEREGLTALSVVMWPWDLLKPLVEPHLQSVISWWDVSKQLPNSEVEFQVFRLLWGLSFLSGKRYTLCLNWSKEVLNESASWMLMFLTCGFSGRLESVMNMWFLAPLKVVRGMHMPCQYVLSLSTTGSELFQPLLLEILVMCTMSVVWVARTLLLPQCLPCLCPVPCIRAGFLGLYTWSSHRLTTRPARHLAKLDIVKYTLFPWWRMRNSSL